MQRVLPAAISSASPRAGSTRRSAASFAGPSYRTSWTLHGLAHLGGALLATGAGLWLALHLGVYDHIVARRLLMVAASATLGYARGGVIMGAYLFVSVGVFRRHANEAFSSLRIEGRKNFLRIRVDARGISLWAFGVDAMPEPWTDAPPRARVIDALTIPAPP